MQELCDLKIHINGQYTFILNQKIILKYSGMLKRIINQEKKKTQIRNSGMEIFDFPGGANGFELISRFCYNNGRISIDPSNVSLLHCSAIFLEMTEKISPFNLIQQTEIFLDGIFYWSWTDILVCLKSCDCFFSYADSSGLFQKLIDSLLSKISQNSDFNFTSSSSSSSSSPETTPDSIITVKRSCSSSRAWWFDDLTILSPKIIEKIIKAMGTFGNDNNSLIITKFLLHYLKTAVQTKGGIGSRPKWSSEYAELANTAVYGVVLMGKTTFSCRGLFWVLRVVSGLGLSRGCRIELERLIGGMLDQATLDDLLVCGYESGGVYDVNLVLRLLRVFVSGDGVPVQRMKKVGRLIDKYMGEISPDQNLKIDKFLGVAESLPDDARDCFDGVYRAIDIYLESHPKLSFEERSKLCRCLNYEKLTLEAAKDMAKNPRIPPRITVQALLSQKTNVSSNKATVGESRSPSGTQMILCSGSESDNFSELSEEKDEMKLNLQRMQWRVLELEKVCREMKGQMSKMVKSKVMSSPSHNKPLPKLCG